MPDLAAFWSFQNRAIIMPIRMANTGPPTTSNRCPSSQAGTAITRQIRMPRAFFLTNSMIRFLSLLTVGVVSYHAVQHLSKKSGAAFAAPDIPDF